MSGTTLEGTPVEGDDPAGGVMPLMEMLERSDSIAIVCHDDPDPDCLASAYALQRLAERRDVDETAIVYGGDISHEQNWAMIESIGIEVRPFERKMLETNEQVAFVDHSVPGRNNSVPTDAEIDIVVDHHPVEATCEGYVDNRPQFGATATMFTGYFRRLGITPCESLATALLFGIRRETMEFVRRSTTLAEYRAAEFLHPIADLDRIQALSESLFTPDTLDAIGSVIENRTRWGSCLVSGAGILSDREPIPLAADYLLNLAGTSTTVVFGVTNGAVEVSARTQDPDVHVGRRLERAFGALGSAGGHRNMAGATIPLDRFDDGPGDPDIEAVDDLVERRVYRCVQDLI